MCDHLEARYEGILRGTGKTIRVCSGIGDQIGAVLLVLKSRRLNTTNYMIVPVLTVLAHFADLSVDKSISTLQTDEAEDCKPQQSARRCHDDAKVSDSQQGRL